MNFSTIENSISEEKKKFKKFLSRFFKNSRILIILLTAAVITAVSLSIWIKSPEYQVLYNHLSNEDGEAVIDKLNQMNVPYQFADSSGQILVPKDKIYEIRLHLAENNLPQNRGVGFELLDKQKFGISQFNEQINYQRALEGELARTIQRINIVKNARVHIAFPKSSLFLQDKKECSASVILDLDMGRKLDARQINAILHLISSSVSDLSIENITIVDQLGNLLNQSSFSRYHELNDLKFKYSEEIESRYRKRIKNILEPLFGIGNIDAQVTAQIDFNDKEKTQEKYSPNTNHKNQAIRSRQTSIHDQIKKQNVKDSLPTSLESNSAYKNVQHNAFTQKRDFIKKSQEVKKYNNPVDADINRDDTINYELNHSVSRTKINTGEIKRLSAAVIINFVKNKNGKTVPLNSQKIKNIEYLIREAIGYSKSRGDSIHVINAPFIKQNEKTLVKIKDSNTSTSSSFLFTCLPWFFSFLLFVYILKKYICPFSKNHNFKTKIINNSKINLEANPETNLEHNTTLEVKHDKENIQKNLSTEKLIHQISQISNQNPRTIALIIRQWMSDKI